MNRLILEHPLWQRGALKALSWPNSRWHLSTRRHCLSP